MKIKLLKYFILILCIYIPSHAFSESSYGDKGNNINQTKINWLLDRSNIQNSRGGITRGKPVMLDTNPSKYFKKLQNNKFLKKKEKDRLAILSMTGEYKVSFEFNEMFGSSPNYKLDVPYKSWGTEVVLVVEDKENFISLQHIMVMYMQDKKGEIMGPFVQKHWRQDWHYEDSEIINYSGNRIWKKTKPNNVKGSWSQIVFQVDDTPRYESYGKWLHNRGASRWISNDTSRPLPRREFSVREDYDFLLGVNKIMIMPWGWSMEEINEKIRKKDIFIGSEYGVARYQKIKDYKFEPAYKYWKETNLYWKEVRKFWNTIVEEKEIFCLNKLVNSKPTYIHFFSQAESFSVNKDIIKSREIISDISNKFLNRDC
tara:strand:- start:545 stop:1657 length:1113 start_codon:yes stop_codon:yes gene_type:complete